MCVRVRACQDALLGGKLADGSIGFEQLCADHAPTNVDEYIRMAQLAPTRPEGWEPAVCAYDTDVGSLGTLPTILNLLHSGGTLLGSLIQQLAASAMDAHA